MPKQTKEPETKVVYSMREFQARKKIIRALEQWINFEKNETSKRRAEQELEKTNQKMAKIEKWKQRRIDRRLARKLPAKPKPSFSHPCTVCQTRTGPRESIWEFDIKENQYECKGCLTKIDSGEFEVALLSPYIMDFDLHRESLYKDE